MMFKVSALLSVAAAFLLATTGVRAVADNAVDACNGSNHYDVGHSCAFANSQGVCELNACGNLVCVAN